MRNGLFWTVIGIFLLAVLGGASAPEPRTLPCLIAKLNVADDFIDDQEIVIALDLWIAQSRVGPEIPQPISDEIMITVIDLWVPGRTVAPRIAKKYKRSQAFCT